MGFALVGLWCLIGPPFVCVVCVTNMVVLWCGEANHQVLVLGSLGRVSVEGQG